jgi:predicted ArsR family transcriptional regulator
VKVSKQKERNKKVVLEYLEKNPRSSRKEIVNGTGMKSTTVYNHLTRLTERGIIARKTSPKRFGKPFVYYIKKGLGSAE